MRPLVNQRSSIMSPSHTATSTPMRASRGDPDSTSEIRARRRTGRVVFKPALKQANQF
jgi:hypothetical protein